MRTVCLIAVLALAACSSQPPQTQTYLLRPQVPAGAATPLVDSGIALGTIRVASYIDQPGLVLASGDSKVHAARNHLWAEPLQVSLRRYLATQVSTGSGREVAVSSSESTRTRINVSVDQLHGDNNGTAVLVAYWDVVSESGTRTFRFSEQQSLSGDGYDALVAAEETLLQRLADAISASLPPA
jgi:uncharacterized lipoprotein YmbA